MSSKESLRSKKLDALYIQYHFSSCLFVYFCLCFTMLRILRDMIGSPETWAEVYGIPMVFTAVVGFVMRRWAKQAVGELGLEDFS